MAITISVTTGTGYFGSIYTQTGAAGAGNWYADETPIPGATGNTYTMEAKYEGDEITFRTASPAEISNVIHLFVPSDVPGTIVGWFDAARADLFTLVSTKVSVWASKVGSLTLSQATDANRPVYSATGRNSKPAVALASGLIMNANTPSLLPGGTSTHFLASVAYASSAGTDYRVFFGWGSGTSGGQYRAHGKNNTGNRPLLIAAAVETLEATKTYLNTDKILSCVVTSAKHDLMVDGETPVVAAVSPNTGVTTYANLGKGRSNDPRQWEGSVQEFVIFSTEPTLGDRQRIDGYKASKWGLRALLPVSHPYKTDNPPVTPPVATLVGDIAFDAMSVTGVMSTRYIFEGSVAFSNMAATGIALQRYAGAIAFDVMSVAGSISHKYIGSASFAAMNVVGAMAVGGSFNGLAQFGDMNTVGAMTFAPHYNIEGAISFGDMGVVGTVSYTPGVTISGAISFGSMSVAGTLSITQLIEGAIMFADMIAQGDVTFIEPDIFPIIWDEMVVLGEITYIAPEIIVEDGSGVPGAESYIDAEYAINYAAARGVILPSDVAILKVHIIKAMDYIERQRSKFKGRVVTDFQYLSFPRSYLYLDGSLYPQNQIPTDIKKAQALLTMYSYQGIDLEPVVKAGGSQFLIRQKLGPIEREYSEAAFMAGSSQPQMNAVSSLLAPFMQAMGMSVYRV